MVPTIWKWCNDGPPDEHWGNTYQQLESVSEILKGAVSQNSATLGNYKMPFKLGET